LHRGFAEAALSRVFRDAIEQRRQLEQRPGEHLGQRAGVLAGKYRFVDLDRRGLLLRTRNRSIASSACATF
jgi:hypothetical protein